MSKVSVMILGRAYDFEVVPGDELLISSVAAYLEDKLNEVQKDTGIVDTQKLAILTALNIAHELFSLKNSRESISGTINRKAAELVHVLDQALSPEGDS